MTKNEKIKNPLLDLVDEGVARTPIRLSFLEKIGYVSILLISLGIFILSVLSLIVDIFIKFSFLFVIDVIFLSISLVASYFILNILRRKMVTEILVDTAFQQGVYSRLEPLIENIASAQTGTDVMLDRIEKIDLKVDNILKEKTVGPIAGPVIAESVMKEYITLGTTLKFAIKSIFMIVITMAIFMFLVNFNLGGITPYATLSIFILWWLFITNEYNLWNDSSAWSMVFFPILIIPVTYIFLSNILNYNVLIALLYLLLGLYSILYYIWAVYVTTGSIPFITPKTRTIEEREEREKGLEGKGEFFSSQQKGFLREIWKSTKKK